MVNNTRAKKVLIIGGGFGGVRTALDLDRARLKGIKITLVSDKPHFEYHAALYRLVTGRSPLEVCIPLRDIFEGKRIEVLTDTITAVDLGKKKLTGSSGASYSYDYLVLALGSEAVYFDIPGLKELSYGFKSITEALRLKRHLHELFESKKAIGPVNFVIIGGGASGVELAGELAVYISNLALRHKFDPSFVNIELVEAASRLVPALPADFSEAIKHRLQQLGVNLFLNRTVLKEDIEQVYLKDLQLKTKTVIWTAGVKPHHLYSNIPGLSLDKKGRVAVDQFLQVTGHDGVFVIGDAAAAEFSGMAQAAIRDGKYVAQFTANKIFGKKTEPHQPKQPFYAIPVGPGWAAVLMSHVRFYGWLGWGLRRLADLRFFLSILPLAKAITAFRNEKTLCEICLICAPEGGDLI